MVNRKNKHDYNSNKAWVPKSYLVNKVGLNSFWIPKEHIHYLNLDLIRNKPKPRKTNFNSTNLGGAKAIIHRTWHKPKTQMSKSNTCTKLEHRKEKVGQLAPCINLGEVRIKQDPNLVDIILVKT